MAQRDIFIKEVTKALEKQSNIFFLSADFGAPALDELRSKFPNNFLHCGISEQAMIDMASGLALEGNKVFVYAMSPFLSLRCIEQAKCGPGLMDLPICFISVGIGLGYADSGPTHYSTEDYACLRSIIGSKVYTPATSEDVKAIASEIIKNTSFSYIRLDREQLPDINHSSPVNAEKGYALIGDKLDGKVVLISHGKMVHRCVEIYNLDKNNFSCINIFRSKPFPKNLADELSKCKAILVVDEQSPSGNLSSCVFENLSLNNFYPKIVNKSLPEKYIFENGGREHLLNINGLSKKDLLNTAKKLI